MRRLIWTSGARIATATLVAALTLRSAVNGSPTIHPIFLPIERALRLKTTIPVLLSSSLPKDFPKHLLATMTVGTMPRSYEVVMSTVKGCISPYCETATIYASPVADWRELPDGKPVILRDGTHAFFHKFTCDMSCHESQISFESEGIRYTVGVKLGRRDQVETLATWMVRLK